jgi:hypothetical protein
MVLQFYFGLTCGILKYHFIFFFSTSSAVLFWFDVWYSEMSFYILFPHLYDINLNLLRRSLWLKCRIMTQVKFFSEGVSYCHFTFTPREGSGDINFTIFICYFYGYWVLTLLCGLWILMVFFLVKIRYMFFRDSGFKNMIFSFFWDLYAPLKIKCFIWLLLQNKILIPDN